MEEQISGYVSRGQLQPLPPPVDESGTMGRVRKHLFSTPLDAVLSVLAGVLVAYVGWNLFQWAVVDAVFVGQDRSACLAEGGGHIGACWAFIDARLPQFVYGLYPVAERWRVLALMVLLALLVVPLLIPSAPLKRLNAVLLFVALPLVGLVLLTGGRFAMSGSTIALVFALASAATLFVAFGRDSLAGRSPLVRVALWATVGAAILALVSYYLPSQRIGILTFRFDLLSAVAFFASLAAIALAIVATAAPADGERRSMAPLLYPSVAAVAFVLVLTSNFGLAHVPTNLWGGLMITLIVALTGIAASLPLGVLLALGRQSRMPAVRLLCIVFIEFWRGVPLITVLFMATFMLPLLLPSGVSFNQLLRVLVGVALFASAYMAEVIRGGLQAIPKGQYEGADAMGLTYWQKMRMIVLPQALTLVIPGIVNTFIGLFKDTSLVYIVGLADLLGTVRRGFSDPTWITPTTPATGLVFGGFVFWLFCFGMSRYSIFMERRLAKGHKR